MTRNEKIARGSHARNLLESETFLSVMDDLLAESFGEFCATEPLNSLGREKCYDITRALGRIRGRLEHYVSDGNLEAQNAEFDKHQ